MSKFDLDVVDVGDKLEAIVAGFREKYAEADSALDCYGNSRNDTWWVDSYTDLKEFSKDWPNVTFIMTDEGEEGYYKYYAKNGEAEFVAGQMSVIYPKPNNFFVSDWSTK